MTCRKAVMAVRPWPIVILAGFHFIAPVFNAAMSAYLLKMGLLEYFRALSQAGWLSILNVCVVLPLAGYSIYKMKEWSYPLFIVLMAWIGVNNFLQHDFAPNLFTLPLLFASYALNIGVVGYFLIPAVRAGYFDRRLRWWETKPRYEVQIPVEFGGSQGTGTITNLSEGGAFVHTSVELTEGVELELVFGVFGFEYRIFGKLMHKRAEVGPGGLRGYGFQFLHSDRTEMQLKQISRSLNALGAKPRLLGKQGWEGFKEWARGLRHGQGLVPKLPSRPAPSNDKVA